MPGGVIPDGWVESAQKIQAEYGIPASVVLGQTIQESSWGDSSIGNNVFGVKATESWIAEGKPVIHTSSPEQDEYGNVSYKVSGFKDYATVYDSFKDYAETLMHDNYTQYTAGVTDSYEYLKGVKAGGYATDINYVDNIWNGIIVPYNLTQYDKAGKGGISIKNNVKGYDTNGKKTTSSTSTTNPVMTKDASLTTAGYILRVVLIILVAGLAILFFVKAFGFSDMLPTIGGRKTNVENRQAS